jgi:hypothetical protein
LHNGEIEASYAANNTHAMIWQIAAVVNHNPAKRKSTPAINDAAVRFGSEPALAGGGFGYKEPAESKKSKEIAKNKLWRFVFGTEHGRQTRYHDNAPRRAQRPRRG